MSNSHTHTRIGIYIPSPHLPVPHQPSENISITCSPTSCGERRVLIYLFFFFCIFFNFTRTCLKPLPSNICIQKLKINPMGTYIVFNFLRSLRQWSKLWVRWGWETAFNLFSTLEFHLSTSETLQNIWGAFLCLRSLPGLVPPLAKV